jgi:hypothetical protein
LSRTKGILIAIFLVIIILIVMLSLGMISFNKKYFDTGAALTDRMSKHVENIESINHAKRCEPHLNTSLGTRMRARKR